jgi:hypothetical protein
LTVHHFYFSFPFPNFALHFQIWFLVSSITPTLEFPQQTPICWQPNDFSLLFTTSNFALCCNPVMLLCSSLLTVNPQNIRNFMRTGTLVYGSTSSGTVLFIIMIDSAPYFLDIVAIRVWILTHSSSFSPSSSIDSSVYIYIP